MISSLERVETMDGDLQKSISWVGFKEDFEKAVSHKYFKREGTPGNYKYYYTEAEYKEAKGGKSEEKKEGEIKIDENKEYNFTIDGYIDSYQHSEPIKIKGKIAEVRQKAKEKFEEYKSKNKKGNYWMTISVENKDNKWGHEELFNERIK